MSCQGLALPPSPYDGVLPVGASQAENWRQVPETSKEKVAIAIWGCPKMVVPPKSSILIGFSIINFPFWGTPIFGNTHILHPGAVNERNS